MHFTTKSNDAGQRHVSSERCLASRFSCNWVIYTTFPGCKNKRPINPHNGFVLLGVKSQISLPTNPAAQIAAVKPKFLFFSFWEDHRNLAHWIPGSLVLLASRCDLKFTLSLSEKKISYTRPWKWRHLSTRAPRGWSQWLGHKRTPYMLVRLPNL